MVDTALLTLGAIRFENDNMLNRHERKLMKMQANHTNCKEKTFNGVCEMNVVLAPEMMFLCYDEDSSWSWVVATLLPLAATCRSA
jgi:hypothetical protein